MIPGRYRRVSWFFRTPRAVQAGFLVPSYSSAGVGTVWALSRAIMRSLMNDNKVVSTFVAVNRREQRLRLSRRYNTCGTLTITPHLPRAGYSADKIRS